jgi:hypothetical protein
MVVAMPKRPLPAAVSLSLSAVDPQTVIRYRRAYESFRVFALEYFDTVLTPSLDPSALDQLCDRYVTSVYHWHDGAMRHLGSHLASGIFQELSPHYRGHLYRLARCMKGWKKLTPVVSARPLPRTWLLLLCCRAHRSGCRRMAAYLYVVFCGYLRAEEGLQLRGQDILVPGGGGRGPADMSAVGLHLRFAKTGLNQYAQVRCPIGQALLRGLARLMPPTARLFPFTNAVVNDTLRALCHGVGLPPVFTCHSLRHGAASNDFLLEVSPAVIRVRGRWLATRSMDIYLQAVAALSAALTPPLAARALLAEPAALEAFMASGFDQLLLDLARPPRAADA